MRTNKDIAILGMSGLFPEADTLDRFYTNLLAGRDSVRPVSDQRKIYSSLDPSPDYKEVAFIERVDQFDYQFFRMAKSEAEAMDPQQRLLLQLACHAIDNAGYSLRELEASRTGVYMAASPTQYRTLLAEQNFLSSVANLNAAAAGRIAYLLNLHGPALMIDTACSSSLVAVVEACKSIQLGLIDWALAGGIRIGTSFRVKGLVHMDNIESPDGRCRTFDNSAGGIGAGEGGGVVLLKSLDAAIRDKDHIRAVIKGFALNQDGGRAIGITAPSPLAQTEVIVEAWRTAGVHPESVGYVEAHGTGTRLGDPIEVKALTDAFAQQTARKKFCAVSSLKSNIGHLDMAAGVASLIKAVLSVEKRVQFPSVHFKTPNAEIDFENTGVYVNTKAAAWEVPEGRKRTAGVSSFGITGTNVHVVLEETPPPPGRPAEAALHHLVTVSAKSATALAQYLRDIQQFLPGCPAPLGDVAFTLNKGRNDYKFRRAFVATGKEDLLAALTHALETEAGHHGAGSEERALALLFSEGAGPGRTVQHLAGQYPVFEARYQECAGYFATGNPKVEQFAYQYALYHLLRSFGISTKNTVGQGVGNQVVAVISGKQTLAQAMEQVLASPPQSPPPDEGKLKRYLQQLYRPVCIEMGEAGILSRLVEQVQGEAAYAFTGETHTPGGMQSLVARLYEANIPVDWDAFYPPGSYRRVAVPGYPFDKVRCWYKEPLASLDADISQWFYRLNWVESECPPGGDGTDRPKKYLVFAAQAAYAAGFLAEAPLHGYACVPVYAGQRFERKENGFRINVAQPEDYTRLYQVLEAEGGIDGIIYFNCSGQLEVTRGMGQLESALEKGIYAQFLLAKAFHPALSRKNFRYVSVSRNGHALEAADQVVLGGSVNFAFVKGLLAEYPSCDARAVDLVGYADEPEMASCLARELNTRSSHAFVARRQAKRYIQELARMEVPDVARAGCPLRDGGTYLITGGASGIGLEVGKTIAARVKATLVVLGRTDMPPAAQWEAWLADERNRALSHYPKVAGLHDLRQRGAEVHYYAAPVDDYRRLSAAMEMVRDAVGTLDGVFHAAGIPGDKTPLKDQSLPAFEEVLHAKIHGTLYLDLLTEPLKPGFLVLFSSINAVVAMPNSTAYAVGNYFLDAYSGYRSQQGRKTLSINWPGWRDTGMSYRTNRNRPVNAAPDGPLRSIRALDGMNALFTALQLAEPNLLIADVDLTHFRVNPYFSLGSGKLAPRVPTSPASPAGAGNDRPEIFNAAGATDTEKMLAGIWIEVLKLDVLNRNDDFFEIGGHSLTGFQVINRIQEQRGLEVDLDVLFEYGRLSELAAYLDALEKAPAPQPGSADIPALAPQPYYEVTHGQRRLWVLHQLEDNPVAYNMPGATVLENLSRGTFERALEALIRRHEALRTTFVEIDGELKQKVHPFKSFGFKTDYVDLRTQKDVDAIAREHARQEASTAFDLATGPLIRAKLLHTGPGKYVFLLTLHHIISDGWSMGVLVREATTIYNAFLQGAADPLPPLRIQYKDYAAWQNQLVAGESLSRQRTYWLNRFSGPLPVLSLPLDKPRPPVKTYNGSALGFSFSQEASQELEHYAQQHGVSLFMVLLAAVNALLYRYSGQRTLVLGIPAAGRNHRDLENQVGFYLNTLALKTDLSGEDSFGQLLQAVKANMLEAIENQQYPFDRLVGELEPVRDTSRLPLFDVMVISQHFGSAEGQTPGELKAGRFGKDFTVSQFDLTFDFSQAEDALTGWIVYNTDLFVPARIGRMAAQLQEILTAVVRDSTVQLDKLNLLPRQERETILGFNRPRTAFPDEATIHHLFEAQVAKTPLALAVKVGSEEWTYGELNDKAARLANYLRTAYAVTPDDLVALLVDRTEWMLVGMLGVLKAGAAYLPVDPAFPPDRINYVLGASGAVLMLSEASLAGLARGPALENQAIENLVLDENWPAIGAGPAAPAPDGATADNLAYVIYTSGSTGRPKGVEITHRAVINLLLSVGKHPGISPGETFLAVTTYAFDISVLELLLPLIKGAAVLLAGKEKVQDPQKLREMLAAEKPSLMQATPSMWKMLLENDWEGSPKLKVLCGGERLSRELGVALLGKCSELWNMYGPTETTIWSTSKHVRTTDDLHTIGRGVDNTSIYVLDGQMNLVPIGVPGEIYIGGCGLARGYRNRPDLTSERFVANPYDRGGEDRLYRTGDEGYWTAGGEVAFIGRRDNQVKIRGYRIELGEIERVLGQHEGVKEAVVLSRKDAAGDDQLVAYLILSGTSGVGAVRTFLAGQLPPYMIPGHLVVLDAFPLTANNKVDRNALPDPAAPTHRAGRHFAGPRSEVESELLLVWQEVLGTDAIGVQDNFFEVGGHSLKAVKILGYLRRMGLEMGLKVIFNNPTIEKLAGEVEARRRTGKDDQVLAESDYDRIIL